MKDFWFKWYGMVSLFVIAGLGIAIIIGLTGAMIERTEAPGAFAQIEQVRKDIKKIGPSSDQYVVGKAVDWNQKIRQKQAYNKTWWADWVVPDSWNQVEEIQIGETKP